MEQNPAHPQSAVPNAAATDHPHEPPKPVPHLRHKKSRGLMHILRVAIFMMRIRPSKSNTLPLSDGSGSMWKKLVGSMRPLHLQSNQSPPQSPEPVPPLPIKHSPSCQSIGEDALSSVSESPRVEGHHHSLSSTSSQYASAVGLNELDQPEENPMEEAIEEEGEENYYDGEGDEMIDAKAEEFIAQFYQQMRLQRLDDMDRRRYKAMSQRSIE